MDLYDHCLLTPKLIHIHTFHSNDGVDYFPLACCHPLWILRTLQLCMLIFDFSSAHNPVRLHRIVVLGMRCFFGDISTLY